MKFSWKGLWVWGLAALLVAATGTSFGQAVYGSIYGTVTDASGALIPNATITVTDTAKGTSVDVKANDNGEFTADHLIPDQYSIRVVSQGFKNYEQNNIRVFADVSLKINAAMAIGGSGETIEVNADTVPLLKADRADVSTTLTSKEIVDLPIPDRNFTNLQLLLPGAQLLGWSHAASENPQGSKQIEVDGQAFAGTAYQLDGTDNQDPILGIIVVNPNSDSLSEAKITTQNFDAEFGKAVSSVVTAQTKSGTNKFHGSIFDYRESSANLAKDPFTQYVASDIPSAIKSQFGGSVGGPIFKDRFFFFGDYQGVRQKVGTSNTQTVPTALLTATCLGTQVGPSGIAGCDFSEYARALAGGGQLIYRNTTTAGVTTSSPYTGNVIPTAEVSPQALALLKLLAPYKPNNPGSGTLAGLVNNYSKSGNGLFNSDQWDVRLDYTFSQRLHAFTRFSRFTDTLTGAVMFGDAGGAGFGIGGYGGTSHGANDSTAAGVDLVINPKLVVDLRGGYLRYNINTSKYDQGTPFAQNLGIPGLNTANSFTSGAPGFQIQETGANLGVFPSQDQGPQYGASLNVNRCNCPLTEREDQFQLANNWTKTLGSHAIKLGADLRYARNLRVPSDSDRTGVLQFNNGPTSQVGTNTGGLGMATLLAGKVTNFSRFVSTSTNAKEFQKRDFFYAQDTWRVTQKLTANYGLRYELYFPESINGPGNGSLLNLSTGYLQVAGIGGVGSNMNYSPSFKAISPRVGLAYQYNSKTVVRAGYGRSFDIGVFGSIFGHAATQNLPVLASQQINQSGGQQTAAFLLSVGPVAPTPVNVPSNGLLPNPGNLVSSHSRPTTLRLPTLDAWNISVQRSITPTLSATAAYVGNKGTHTLGDQSGQQTNPNEPAITLPASYSVNGQALHYDPAAGTALPTAGQTATGNSLYLQRYYGGNLPACQDAYYTASPATGGPGGVRAPNGGCGWNNSIQYYGDDLDTHYNALQLTLTKQMTHGYTVTGNYAYQQALSENTSYSTWNRAAVRGRDGALRQQQLITYGLFQLPFGRNKAYLNHVNPVVNQIVSGFEINPVLTWSSGLPFTLNYSGCSANLPGGAPCYVNGDPGKFTKHITGAPGGPNGGKGLSFYDSYNLSGSSTPFSVPGLDQIGTAGRNTAFGPRLFNTDLSIQKNFSIRERLTLQVRADAFNAFNHINFGGPNGNIDQGGSIGGGPYPNGANPRQMQFSGRIEF
ncbi:MAG TPA: TonB-dependent receptor [Acidobacteriaceae bacterium]